MSASMACLEAIDLAGPAVVSSFGYSTFEASATLAAELSTGLACAKGMGVRVAPGVPLIPRLRSNSQRLTPKIDELAP